MTSTQKVIATGGVAALVVLNVVAFFHVLDNNDPPILIGDGSILFSADRIDKNSNKQLEVSKLLHKVYSITTVDLSPGGSKSTMDVKGKDWTLTSASGAVVVSLDPLVVGQGVKADCSSDWNGIGTYYSCDPTNGSKLTPATLTFSAGNGPASCTSTCALSCMSGKCQIRLDYKK
jgi:hypothetical protein